VATRFAAPPKRCDSTGWFFVVTYCQNPCFFSLFAAVILTSFEVRVLTIHFTPLLFPTLVDKGTDVDDIILADNDVFATRANRISWFDNDLPLAVVTENFQAAYHSPTMEVTIVEPVFLHNVMVETV
jgi:hypothetical protein